LLFTAGTAAFVSISLLLNPLAAALLHPILPGIFGLVGSITLMVHAFQV
jgi:hypothetical protein